MYIFFFFIAAINWNILVVNQRWEDYHVSETTETRTKYAACTFFPLLIPDLINEETVSE
jgi:hypothetical protein